MLRILIIEDHVLVREGLALVTKKLADSVSVLEAGSAETGLRMMGSSPDLDLVLLDLALPGIDGLTCLQRIRRQHPAVPVVVISAHDDVQTIERAIQEGALGFIPKAYGTEMLLAALRQVLDGRVFLPGRLIPAKVNGVLSRLNPVSAKSDLEQFGLTERQAQVLGLMAEGRTNREIAETMCVCEGTVKLHITAVFRTLGVSNRTQALLAISRAGN